MYKRGMAGRIHNSFCCCLTCTKVSKSCVFSHIIDKRGMTKSNVHICLALQPCCCGSIPFFFFFELPWLLTGSVFLFFIAALPLCVAVVNGAGLSTGLLLLMKLDSGSGPGSLDDNAECDPYVKHISG